MPVNTARYVPMTYVFLEYRKTILSQQPHPECDLQVCFIPRTVTEGRLCKKLQYQCEIAAFVGTGCVRLR